MPYCLGIGSTRVGPGLHPQYTRAWYAREAVGGPSNSTSRNTAQTSVEHSSDEHVTEAREQSPMMCKSPMTRKRERNSHMVAEQSSSNGGWNRVRHRVQGESRRRDLTGSRLSQTLKRANVPEDECSPKRPVFALRSFCCTCLRTTKQWSRWSLKEGVPQWDMFPGPTGLRLIGCSIELTWTQKSKSCTSTPKTNSLTF